MLIKLKMINGYCILHNMLQTLKEQFLDVEAILAGLQHNILEPECLASLDQNYYVTVKTWYKRRLKIELDTF